MKTLSLFRIFCLVAGAHMLLILFSIFWAASPPVKMPSQKIAVQTITLQPREIQIPAKPAKPAVAAIEEKKEAKVSPKETPTRQIASSSEDKVKTVEAHKPAGQSAPPPPLNLQRSRRIPQKKRLRLKKRQGLLLNKSL